ncbi:MAG: 16S rRNA (guanine(966)-N(2))-methyltransferase RsmD [Erysipelotrichaceae bacterium]|nr:16S rRNA (guanine(966)-N(2))-methyltransferase RsmD [Erysipelotrichaceae bacterium]
MRVVSGKYRGKKLLSPIDEKTRPTSDKVKESLFNIIGNYISDAVCLDLFSGSGALGIEAISRGAKKVVFNDLNKNSIRIIKDNLASLKNIETEYQVYNLDYLDFLKQTKEKYDVVFLDPPYAKKIHEEIIKYMQEKDLLNQVSIIAIETDVNDTIENKNYSFYKEYKYGTIKLTVLRIEK